MLRTVDETLALTRTGKLEPSHLEAALLEIRRLATVAAEALTTLECEHHKLAAMYTLQLRLFDDLRPNRVCEAISETAVNFLGTEDFVIFLRAGEEFSPHQGMGPSFTQARAFRFAEGQRGRLAQAGDSTFGHAGTVVQACLASSSGPVLGLIEIGTLLRHKPRLTFDDRELIATLRTRAGAALQLALERSQGGAP